MKNAYTVTSVSEFTVGGALSRALSTLLRRPFVFFGLMLIAIVPAVVLRIMGLDTFSGLVNFVLGLGVQGAVAYTVFRTRRGEYTSLGESLSRGMARVFPLIGAGLLTGILTAIGFVLLIVPGLIVFCSLILSTSVCVVERLGPIDSMKRSAELTKGHRWKIFGLYMLCFLLFFVVIFLGSFLGVLLAFGSKTVAILLVALLFLCVLSFGSVLVAVVYYDLRAVKDGVTVDSLANAFD